jgi:outer membrane protein OmpA-like peptidoglycan-associated protein
VELIGHADRLQGRGHDYNRGLSERRALTVRNLLVERGVEAGTIEYRYKGDTEQVQACEGVKPRQALRECLAPNRRVEVRMVVGQ